MKFSTVAAAGLAATAHAISNYAATGCVKGVHVIALGGEYTTQGNLSYLETLASGILTAIPNSNMYQVPYQLNATPQTDLATGIPDLITHIQDYAASCPNTKQVLIGYSIGAAILMDVFCGGIADATNPSPLDIQYRGNVLAAIAYGDPTATLGQRSHEGTCTAMSGQAARALPGRCFPFGRKTKSYCDAGDPACCGGPHKIGDAAIHFTYPAKYDGQAVDWVKAKWNYYRRNR